MESASKKIDFIEMKKGGGKANISFPYVGLVSIRELDDFGLIARSVKANDGVFLINVPNRFDYFFARADYRYGG